MMTGRRIDPEIIAEIEHLLRTTNLSCRGIAIITDVGRGLVNDLKSGERAAKNAAAEVAVADRRIAAPSLGRIYHRCSCGAKARRPIGQGVCLACGLHQSQRQGTPDGDDKVVLDLQDEHKVEYEKMKILARARHEARDKKSLPPAASPPIRES